MAAAHFGVTNLTAIIDYNHLQTDGTTEDVMDIGDVRRKFEAFDWDTVEIDGHDMAAVVEALEWSRTRERPAAIVCQTRKGCGVSLMEDTFGFHGKPPTAEQAEQALTELEADARRAGRRAGALEVTPVRDKDPVADPHGLRRRAAWSWASTTRTSSRSTPTSRSRRMSIKFGSKFPERFFNVGAAEANMMSMACGLADHRQGALRVDVRDLRHRPRLRPGAARHRPQRAARARLRVARRACRWARTARRTR